MILDVNLSTKHVFHTIRQLTKSLDIIPTYNPSMVERTISKHKRNGSEEKHERGGRGEILRLFVRALTAPKPEECKRAVEARGGGSSGGGTSLS